VRFPLVHGEGLITRKGEKNEKPGIPGSFVADGRGQRTLQATDLGEELLERGRLWTGRSHQGGGEGEVSIFLGWHKKKQMTDDSEREEVLKVVGEKKKNLLIRTRGVEWQHQGKLGGDCLLPHVKGSKGGGYEKF